MKRAAVLIVEDDHDIAAIAEEALREGGFSVSVTSRADEVRRAVALGIDVALVDIHLPGCSGWDLVDEMMSSSTPVAIFSVHETDPDVRARAASAGVGFVSKSEPERIVDGVRALLARSNSRGRNSR